MTRFGDPDGHGRYGILDEDPDGLLCAHCGTRHRHLGLHVWKAHGLTAAQYRETHGLLRSRGLVAQDLRLVMATNAGAHYGENAGLARSRDPARASAARLARKMPASAQEAEGRDRRMAEVGRSARRATVVLCQGCGVAFCPLVDVARRRFCTRSCASRHTRSQDRQPSPHAAAPS